MTHDIIIAQMQNLNARIKSQESLVRRLALKKGAEATRERAEETLDELNDKFIMLVNRATELVNNASSI
jgi:hypothetical protein